MPIKHSMRRSTLILGLLALSVAAGTTPALAALAPPDTGTLSAIAQVVGATDAWRAGYTGKGVDVALIDSGVAKVPGLTSGNVVYGPDLSFDSQVAGRQYTDGYGHGTHLASIIAGRDVAGTPASYAGGTAGFTGIAPDARVISLKVGASDGAADVSQVIAAIGWVTAHAHDNGLNIRVLNLAYGLDSVQAYQLDPLAYAVERAWRAGILVVVAAGNDGTTRQELASPATDPYVLAVGAEDPNGTLDVQDDTVPAFAQRGTAARHVDVVAPGVHVLGLRAPGSTVDLANPGTTRFLRGSGTSQATAVLSGVAALAFQRFPTATPDQVKSAIMRSGRKFAAAKDYWQGVGVVSATAAQAVPIGTVVPQVYPVATGAGTLEAARGTVHVTVGGSALTGERDIFGRPWTASSAQSWSGGSFNGGLWTGTAWGGTGTWALAGWGTGWYGGSWSGLAWDSRTWVSRTWAGVCWG
jgi:serine protease AprX